MTHDDLWREWTRKGIDALAVFDVDPHDYYTFTTALLHPDTLPDDFLRWMGTQDQKLKENLKGEYRNLSREFHPDMLQRFSSELIGQATKVFTNVTTVYEVLIDPQRYEVIPHDTVPPTSPMMEYVQSLHATGLRIRDHPARRDVELMLAKKNMTLE
ncbi:MAG: DnaJ domain-containing protein, partial [Nanoarchaeota archaeon]